VHILYLFSSELNPGRHWNILQQFGEEHNVPLPRVTHHLPCNQQPFQITQGRKATDEVPSQKKCRSPRPSKHLLHNPLVQENMLLHMVILKKRDHINQVAPRNPLWDT